jgi:hypothetical protein
MGGQDQGNKTEMREALEYKKDKAIEKKRMHTFFRKKLVYMATHRGDNRERGGGRDLRCA